MPTINPSLVCNRNKPVFNFGNSPKDWLITIFCMYIKDGFGNIASNIPCYGCRQNAYKPILTIRYFAQLLLKALF